jgi:hypothetical protein
MLISTIDSDIANIPDNEFRTVFAGGIAIMFGSVLSTIFVGFLIESNGGGYADLVAETYAEQNMGDGEETFLNSLGLVSVCVSRDIYIYIERERDFRLVFSLPPNLLPFSSEFIPHFPCFPRLSSIFPPSHFLHCILLFVIYKNADQKTETVEMVRTFREKKMRKAGTWTAADEDEKRQFAEEKDMFSDYD